MKKAEEHAYPRPPMSEPATKLNCPVRPFWRRLGVVAFVLFLLKGLAWLIIPALAATGWMSAR
jgi:hypothetical protein